MASEFFLAITGGICVSLWNKYILPKLPRCDRVDDDDHSDASCQSATSDIIHDVH